MTEYPPPRLEQRQAPVDPLLRTPVPRAAGARPPVKPPTRRSGRRRHPARGARIAATGLGLTTMFGLVAAMGIAAVDGASATAPPDSVPTPVLQNQPAAPAPAATPAAPTPVPAAPAAPTAGPTVLTARPDVRVITPQAPTASPAPAPAATTRGSS